MQRECYHSELRRTYRRSGGGFRLVDLVFPEPRDYRLQLFGAGQFLQERRFLIIPLENPGKP